MIRLWLTSLIFMLVAVTCDCQAEARQGDSASDLTLQWGFVHMPPLIYQGEDGLPKGVLAELMHGTSLHSGVAYEPMEFPNARAIYNLNQQKVNFAIGIKSLVKNPANFLISDVPVATMQLNIVWQKGTEGITSINDLQDKRIVLLAGYTYGGLRSKLEAIASGFVEVETTHRALAALELNRGHYALTYKTASAYSMSEDKELGFESVVIANIDVHFILSTTVPQAKRVMTKLEAGFQQYQQSLLTEDNKLNIE